MICERNIYGNTMLPISCCCCCCCCFGNGGGGGESGGDSMTKLLALPDCWILLFLEELNTNLPEVSQTQSRRVEKRKKKNKDRALHLGSDN